MKMPNWIRRIVLTACTPDMLGKVFDCFTQVDGTIKMAKGGIGIGLSLVKGWIERHGGSVQARSDGLGQGSEFLVRLPLSSELPLEDRYSSQNDEIRGRP